MIARALDSARPHVERMIVVDTAIAESAWKRCLEIGEQPGLDGAVAGRGGYMAAKTLAAFYGTLGRKALEAEYETLAAAEGAGPAAGPGVVAEEA